MQVQAHIDADKASAEFREARRDLNRQTRRGLIAAGERVALPAAKRNAFGLRVEGRSVAGSLQVRSTQRTAYLSSNFRGRLNRAVGLLEFGGTVTTPIYPTNGRALAFGNGQFAASVTGPRHYQGRHFLSDAVSKNQRRIEDAILDEVAKAYDGFEVRK